MASKNINKQYEKFTTKFFGLEYNNVKNEDFNKTSRF